MNSITTMVIVLCEISIFAGMVLLVRVITQAMKDLHLNRTDSRVLLRARKWTFFGDAIYLLVILYLHDYWLDNPSVIATGLVVTGLVVGGASILVVSSKSMEQRAPPSNGHGYCVPVSQTVWRRMLRHVIPIRDHRRHGR